MAIRASCAALVLLALAACGTDPERGNSIRRLGGQIFSRGAQPAAQAPLPTRAQIDQAPGSYLLARIEATGGDAMLVPAGRNGNVRTWTTAAGTTLALRDGVLTETRGLRGADLMSATVPPLSRLQSGTGSVRRTMFTLSGDDRTVRSDYLCELRNAGAETVIVIERSYPTRHIVEACTGATAGFENHYWIEPSGSLRRSRQWIGPELGSVELDLLKD